MECSLAASASQQDGCAILEAENSVSFHHVTQQGMTDMASSDRAVSKGILEREKINDALFPSRPSSIDSDSQASQAAARDNHCILLRKLKKIFWREKVRVKKLRTPPNTER